MSTDVDRLWAKHQEALEWYSRADRAADARPQIARAIRDRALILDTNDHDDHRDNRQLVAELERLWRTGRRIW